MSDVIVIAKHSGSSPSNPHPDWWDAKRVEAIRGRLYLVHFRNGEEIRELIQRDVDLPEWLDAEDTAYALDVLDGKVEPSENR